MEPAPGLIELRLNHVGQLFNTMDPSPFLHERDLDHDAEEFIVSWARELRIQGRPELRLRVVLHQAEDPAVTELVRQSLRHYFAYRAEVSRPAPRGAYRVRHRADLPSGHSSPARPAARRRLGRLGPRGPDHLRLGRTLEAHRHPPLPVVAAAGAGQTTGPALSLPGRGRFPAPIAPFLTG